LYNPPPLSPGGNLQSQWKPGVTTLKQDKWWNKDLWSSQSIHKMVKGVGGWGQWEIKVPVQGNSKNKIEKPSLNLPWTQIYCAVSNEVRGQLRYVHYIWKWKYQSFFHFLHFHQLSWNLIFFRLLTEYVWGLKSPLCWKVLLNLIERKKKGNYSLPWQVGKGNEFIGKVKCAYNEKHSACLKLDWLPSFVFIVIWIIVFLSS